jgi:hypothetical protein
MGDGRNMIKEGFENITGRLKEGKVRIILIYEDISHKEFYLPINKDYRFVINDKTYMLLPDCIITGKNPLIIYFYNNPMPLRLKYKYTKLTAINFYSKDKKSNLSALELKELENTPIDATALNVLTTSKIINEMFNSGGIKFNWKYILIGFVVVCVVVLGYLHFSGTMKLW